MSDIRVFLVDDSIPFLQATSRFLALQPGIAVVGEFASAAGALENADQLKPDLVLMDLAMPGLNGLEATRIIKQKTTPPRVIIVTMYDNQEYRSAADAVRADGFITKTELGSQLLPLIQVLFEGYLQPEQHPIDR